MGHDNFEEAKKKVYKGMVLLGVVTLIEVLFSLFGKGHIVAGMENITWVAYVVGFIIIALSLYKAYFIVYEFMHMKYEAKGLAMTVLMPTLLLVWAVIAFFQEGSEWGNSREDVKNRNEIVSDKYFEDDNSEGEVIIINQEDIKEEEVHEENH